MEGAESGPGEKSEKESPPLQIDPKCFQDALRAFFQPIKTDDPRLDFYTMYKREATEYDTDYIKKYDEDLNTTLIFAGLFSAVSSAFVIDVHSELQPDPNEQSVALLRAILLTLNQSAIPGETPTVPPIQEDPPSEIATVTGLMYASLLISLLAAFVAMLGKQWLNRYLRNSGGSMIERCGDRQRKCDGLQKWPLHFFVESLPLMLQVALLLLACGLCRHMWSINISVAYALITLTGLGVVFYLAIVVAGMSSYACPFQTPVSTALRSPWKKVRRGIVSAISWVLRVMRQRVRPLLRRQSLPMIPLENVQVQGSKPWLTPKDIATIRSTNANDVRCVSWILRNITDPEALEAAIRLAGTIRWFEDGTDVEPPYDLIISTFEACFDSTGEVYPGSMDRAYYSGRAIVWIQTLAMCKSEDFANMFPSPTKGYRPRDTGSDLGHILLLNADRPFDHRSLSMLYTHTGHTTSHLRWISNVLLHLSWANRAVLDIPLIRDYAPRTKKPTIPLDVMLNRLLVWCIFLGSPVEEDALKVQDKSDRLERILRQLSKAIVSAITRARDILVPHILRDLIKLEDRPWCLTVMAYEWCSVICENHNLERCEGLLLATLEFGFRHLNPRVYYIEASLSHTEYHQELASIAFRSQRSEGIADLLYAWTTHSRSHAPAHTLLGTCAEHLVDLHNLVPFSPRLRQLVVHSVELIGYKGFEGVGVERFIEMLNHLHITADDMDLAFEWATLLLDTLRSSEATQLLSLWYWELLMEFAIRYSWWLRRNATYSPQIVTFLTEAQEWSKLECWIGTVWMVWPPGTGGATEGDLGRSTELLLHQRPGAAQKLEQWMGRWGQESMNGYAIPESFQRICKQAHEEAQWDAPPIPAIDKGTEEPLPFPPSGGNELWESLPY